MTTAVSNISISGRIQRRLADAVGSEKYKLWFHSAKVRVNDEVVELSVPSRFVAEWIDQHFHSAIQDAAQAEFGHAVIVRTRVDASQRVKSAGEKRAQRVTETPTRERRVSETPRPRNDTGPRFKGNGGEVLKGASGGARSVATSDTGQLRYRLDDLVIGRANELASSVARQIADQPDSPLASLFVHGGCGLGKTHLLQGLCRRFAEVNPDGRWLYTTAEQFTNEYVYAVRNNQLPKFRRAVRQLDLLAIDDVHFFSNKSSTQNELLHTFDTIGMQGAKLVFASDAHPKMIDQMTEAVVSRFMCGMVVRIDAPDVQMRCDIIRSVAKRRGMMLLDSVVTALAEQAAGSVREIEGMLTKLGALAQVSGGVRNEDEPIGHALVNRLFSTGATSMDRRPIRFEQILNVVCEQMGVERASVMSSSRHRRIVMARSVAIHLARHLTTLSYPELARALGRSNHSTIVTADHRIDDQVKRQAPVPLNHAMPVETMDQLVEHLLRLIQEKPSNAA